jgi:urea transporter
MKNIKHAILYALKIWLSHFLLFSGSMAWLNDRLTPLGGLDFFNSVLRGISQVVFINNPVSGLLIIIVITMHYPYLGIMGLIGCCMTTFLAIRSGFSITDIRNGIYGFGGTLIGFALSVLAVKFSEERYYYIVFIMLVCLLSYFNILIIKRLGFWFSNKTGLPFFTLPYNFAVFFLIAMLLMLYPDFIKGGSLHFSDGDHIGPTEMIEATFVTFGQVFFVGDVDSSILLFFITVIFSPVSAICAVLGAAVFVLIALFVGFDNAVILSGVIGYNVVLTALVVGAIVHLFSIKSVLISMAAAIWSAMVSLGLASVLVPLGLPVLTLPFCVATISFLFVLWKFYPDLLICTPYKYSSPEENICSARYV